MFWNCVFVGVGGFIGSVFRYLISLIPALTKFALPLQTLLVNVVGAYMIGVIIGMCEQREGINEHMLLLLKVGVCGGFTTFSTFSAETFGLFEEGKSFIAVSYVLLSVLLCLAGIFAGKTTAACVAK